MKRWWYTLPIVDRLAMRRFNRLAVHKYWAAVPGRSCNFHFRGGPCFRCLPLDVTGINRRRQRAWIAAMKDRKAQTPATPAA